MALMCTKLLQHTEMQRAASAATDAAQHHLLMHVQLLAPTYVNAIAQQ